MNAIVHKYLRNVARAMLLALVVDFLCIGVIGGGLASLILMGLRMIAGIELHWLFAVLLPAAGAGIVVISALVQGGVSLQAAAEYIDRHAGLDERLASALASSAGEGDECFRQALQEQLAGLVQSGQLAEVTLPKPQTRLAGAAVLMLLACVIVTAAGTISSDLPIATATGQRSRLDYQTQSVPSASTVSDNTAQTNSAPHSARQPSDHVRQLPDHLGQSPDRSEQTSNRSEQTPGFEMRLAAAKGRSRTQSPPISSPPSHSKGVFAPNDRSSPRQNIGWLGVYAPNTSAVGMSSGDSASFSPMADSFLPMDQAWLQACLRASQARHHWPARRARLLGRYFDSNE